MGLTPSGTHSSGVSYMIHVARKMATTPPTTAAAGYTMVHAWR